MTRAAALIAACSTMLVITNVQADDLRILVMQYDGQTDSYVRSMCEEVSCYFADWTTEEDFSNLVEALMQARLI